MQSKWSAVLVVCVVVAAVGGCARVGSEADAADGSVRTEAGKSGGGSGAGAGGHGDGLTPDQAGGLAPEVCPREYPVIGTACRSAQPLTCTYHGDGPCSVGNPDRIAACQAGKWVSLAPAIRCPGVGPVDCERPRVLGDYCNQEGRDCSTSLAARQASYCDPMLNYVTTRLQRNACAGTSLLMRFGNSGMRFDYDGAGELRSVQSYDDVPFGACEQTHYTYGTPCELTGELKPACEDASSGDDAGT